MSEAGTYVPAFIMKGILMVENITFEVLKKRKEHLVLCWEETGKYSVNLFTDRCGMSSHIAAAIYSFFQDNPDVCTAFLNIKSVLEIEENCNEC